MVHINSIHLKDNAKASNVLWLFYVSLFFKFTFSTTSLGLLFSFLSTFIALSITCVLYNQLTKFNQFKKFILLMFLFAVSCSVYSNNYRLNDYLLSIQYFGVALIPIFYKLNYSLFKWTLIILILYFIFHIVIGTNPNNIFSTSRNTVSIFLLIFYSYHVISAVQNKYPINIVLLCASFFISIWAMGRGGIVSIGFLLIVMPFCRDNKISIKLLLTYILIFIVLIYIVVHFGESVLKSALMRFDSMGMDSNGRDEPNAEYLRLVFSSVFNFLFGGNLVDNPVFEALDLNPHNSLIRLHVYYGFCGFLLVAFFSIRSLIKYLIGINWVYIVLFLALFMRSLVDSAAFHGPFDGILYYLILYPIYFSGKIYVKS